jgi:predicted RNA-binding protein
MCEANVFLLRGGEKEEVMRAAVEVRDEGDVVVVVGMLGKRIEVPGARIVGVDIHDHEVLLMPRG